MIEKQEVQEIFPTPLWIVDLQAAAAAALNASRKSEIERIIEPRPRIPPGSNWQTPQDLHTRPAFAEFVKLVETAARGVASFLRGNRTLQAKLRPVCTLPLLFGRHAQIRVQVPHRHAERHPFERLR